MNLYFLLTCFRACKKHTDQDKQHCM